jgi:hypothetical protein
MRSYADVGIEAAGAMLFTDDPGSYVQELGVRVIGALGTSCPRSADNTPATR